MRKDCRKNGCVFTRKASRRRRRCRTRLSSSPRRRRNTKLQAKEQHNAKKFVKVGNIKGKIKEEKKPQGIFGTNREKTDKAKEFKGESELKYKLQSEMESKPEEKKPMGFGNLNHNAKAEIGESKLKERKSPEEIVKYNKPQREYMEPKLEEKKTADKTVFITNKEKAGKTKQFKLESELKNGKKQVLNRLDHNTKAELS